LIVALAKLGLNVPVLNVNADKSALLLAALVTVIV
jgi:hypothetical protein